MQIKKIRLIKTLLISWLVLTSKFLHAQETSSQLIVKLKKTTSETAFASSLVSVIPKPNLSALMPSKPTSFRGAYPGAGLLKETPLSQYYVLNIGSDLTRSQAIALLQKNPNVELVEPNHYYYLYDEDYTVPNDQYFSRQSYLNSIRAPGAWKITKGSKEVKIAIIDSGIDHDHPDLQEAIFINEREDINQNGTFEPWLSTEMQNGKTGDYDGIDQDGNGYVDDVSGWSFTDFEIAIEKGNGFPLKSYNSSPDTDDKLGHGTRVAGIIGAMTNNSIGVAGLVPKSTLIPIKTFYSEQTTVFNIARAVIYAVENGADVINMSLGTSEYSSNLLRESVQYAYQKGITVVTAAGNVFSQEPNYPAAFEETIAVTGVSSDGKNTSYSFGNHIDLSAPGSDIYTTAINNQYASSSGTSFSSPMVTGAVALMLSLSPDLSPEAIKGILKTTAENIGLPEQGWDIYTGAGRLNVEKSAYAVLNGLSSVLTILQPSIKVDDFYKKQVSVIGTVTSPYFESYGLYFKLENSTDNSWIPIVENQSYQKINDTLGIWNTSKLEEGTYFLRLVLSSQDDPQNIHQLETRKKIYLDTTQPKIQTMSVEPILFEDGYRLWVTKVSNENTLGTLLFKENGTNNAYSNISLGLEGNFTLYEADMVEIPDDFLGKDLELRLSIQDEAGLTSLSDPVIVNVPKPNHPDANDEKKYLVEKKNLLPFGLLFEKAIDVDRNGKTDIFITKPTGVVARLEWNGESLQKIDSLEKASDFLITASIQDIDQDAHHELMLTSFSSGTYVYEQESQDGSPFQKLQSSNSETIGILFAQTKGTDEWQIIGRNRESYLVMNTTLNILHQLPSPANSTNGSPDIEGLKAICQDFDQDGTKEILMADRQGNFYAYEWDGSTYKNTFFYQTGNFRGSNWLASGDFLGNGKHQFALATQVTVRNGDQQMIQNLWKLELWESDGNDSYKNIWSKNIFSLENLNFSSLEKGKKIASGNIDNDPQDELLVASHSTAYLFKGNAEMNGLKLVWSASNRTNGYEAEILDINSNGMNEVVFSEGEVMLSWHKGSSSEPTIPTNVIAESISENQIRISWNAPQIGPTPTTYNIWRAETSNESEFALNLSLYQSGITDFSFVDNNVDPVQNKKYYFYAVQSEVNGNKSSLSHTLRTFTAEKLRALSASAKEPNFINVVFSAEVDVRSLITSNFSLTKNDSQIQHIPSRLFFANSPKNITLAFSGLETGNYTLNIKNIVAKGSQTMLENQSASLSLIIDQTLSNDFLYLKKYEVLSGYSVALFFSEPMEKTSTENIANYGFYPVHIAQVQSVKLDESDRTKVILTFSENFTRNSIGYDISITIKNVKSESGKEINSENGGNSIAFRTKPSETLDNVFIYPNPFRYDQAASNITFSNLDQKGSIQIFSAFGKRVKTLDYNTLSGSLSMELFTDNGEKIESGIYLFKVVSETGGVKLGKFVVIR